jgi:sporulation-control protein spo0M
MIGKIKKWLGIEGVKIDLELDDEYLAGDQLITGKLLLYSMHEQEVTSIHLKLVEKYTRGRRRSKLIDEYTLGELLYEEPVLVPSNEMIEIEFDLPFDLLKSDMDKFGDYNFITRGFVEIAKKIKNANSIYRLEVDAKVKGTALHPFVKRSIYLT